MTVTNSSTRQRIDTASLSHLRDLPLYRVETPYEIWADELPSHIPRTNVELELIHGCVLQDVRTTPEDMPKLEIHGFEYLSSPFPWHTGIKTVDDIGYSTVEEKIALNSYLGSVSEELRERYGCIKVLCWDWRVRRSKSTAPRTTPGIYSLQGKEGNELRATQINSSHLIHSDGSPNFMKRVLHSVLRDERAEWNDPTKYRVRCLTVWRPLVDIVETDPLVLCDVRTVEDSDWDVIDKVLDESVEESMYLKRRERHRWYWMSDQTRDEAIVMTVWDSARPDSRSASAPHCAMVLPDVSAEAKPRSSIEVRLLVWNEIK